MAVKSLAVKYRPSSFEDVVEQGSIKTILQQQLSAQETKNAYLFCGGAGTGKTTCARIFANEINKHQGNPIEMDAASNSSVEDVRGIINQAKTKSIDSFYKVFIIDECHSLSNTAWQALLKLLEEPPARSIFIFCTTDPQKIPKTILSRVQRYDFQRISHSGIVNRLHDIISWENSECLPMINGEMDALDYIAKIADGGMRDAITLLDKCLAYSEELSLANVVTALGVADYDSMFDLLWYIVNKKSAAMLSVIDRLHNDGKDLKQFIRLFTEFVLDVSKYLITKSTDYIRIPASYKNLLDEYIGTDLIGILGCLVRLNADIKWDNAPKPMIEATLLLECEK